MNGTVTLWLNVLHDAIVITGNPNSISEPTGPAPPLLPTWRTDPTDPACHSAAATPILSLPLNIGHFSPRAWRIPSLLLDTLPHVPPLLRSQLRRPSFRRTPMDTASKASLDSSLYLPWSHGRWPSSPALIPSEPSTFTLQSHNHHDMIITRPSTPESV